MTGWYEFAALLLVNAPEKLTSGFDPKAWIENDWNIALRIDDDLGMFECACPDVYRCHVWFSSRGGEALRKARAMIREMAETYGARTLAGETPTDRPDAWLFARMLGFKRWAERNSIIVSVLHLRELS